MVMLKVWFYRIYFKSFFSASLGTQQRPCESGGAHACSFPNNRVGTFWREVLESTALDRLRESAAGQRWHGRRDGAGAEMARSPGARLLPWRWGLGLASLRLPLCSGFVEGDLEPDLQTRGQVGEPIVMCKVFTKPRCSLHRRRDAGFLLLKLCSCEKPGVTGAVINLLPAPEGFGRKSLLEMCLHDKGFLSRPKQVRG